jgi:hypothetical protein
LIPLAVAALAPSPAPIAVLFAAVAAAPLPTAVAKLAPATAVSPIAVAFVPALALDAPPTETEFAAARAFWPTATARLPDAFAVSPTAMPPVAAAVAAAALPTATLPPANALAFRPQAVALAMKPSVAPAVGLKRGKPTFSQMTARAGVENTSDVNPTVPSALSDSAEQLPTAKAALVRSEEAGRSEVGRIPISKCDPGECDGVSKGAPKSTRSAVPVMGWCRLRRREPLGWWRVTQPCDGKIFHRRRDDRAPHAYDEFVASRHRVGSL